MRKMLLRDETFVAKLIIAGAKGGHFAPEYASSQLAGNYVRATVNGAICIGHENDIRGTVGALFGNVDRGPIAFLTAMDWQSGSTDTDVELHMASVSPNHRRRGLAEDMIGYFVSGYPKPVNFWARCRPASTIMRHTLLKLRFEAITTTTSLTTLMLPYNRRSTNAKTKTPPEATPIP